MNIIESIKQSIRNKLAEAKEERVANAEIRKKMRSAAFKEREKQMVKLSEEKEKIRGKRLLDSMKNPREEKGGFDLIYDFG